MKKGIILTHSFLPEAVGGASRIYEMARLLQQFYNIDIICPPPTYPFAKYKKAKYLFCKENIREFHVFRIWTYQPSTQTPSFFQRVLYYTIFPTLALFFLIIHLHNASFVIISIPPPSLLITTLIIRLFKKKLIIDVRDLWVDAAASLSYIKKDSLLARLVKKFEKYCWRKSDLLMTNSMIIYDILSITNGNKNNIKYFPFNVDLHIFKKINVMGEKQIVYIGNFGAAQNLMTLIHAMSIVLEKIPDLKIQFYGGGDRELDMKKLVIDLNLEDYIKFNDPVPRERIPLILSQSTLGIIALADNKALRYAIPTKTFEYFACGLPVLAYGSSDELERVIMESGAGIYVRGNDQKEIANAIIRLFNDKTTLEEYSINARKFIEQNTGRYSFLSDL